MFPSVTSEMKTYSKSFTILMGYNAQAEGFELNSVVLNKKDIFLFSTVNIFKTKYEFVLTELRSLANNSELGGDESTICYNTLQNKYIHLAECFADLVRLVSLGNFERHSTNITVTIQNFLFALYNYTVRFLQNVSIHSYTFYNLIEN